MFPGLAALPLLFELGYIAVIGMKFELNIQSSEKQGKESGK